MRDKGYAFPLHSLDLLRPGEAPPQGPLFVLPAPEGRLVVSGPLLRRGRNTTAADVRQALLRGLAHHGTRLAQFSTCGLDAGWAAAMRHWGERLREDERRQLTGKAALALSLEAGRSRRARAGQLLARLGLAARLGGLPPLTAGRAPRAELALLDALRLGSTRAAAHAAALAAAGFSAEDQAELAALARALPAARDALREEAEAPRAGAAALAVLRGALLGDLSRLSLAAPHVLPPSEAAHLQQRALLA